MVTQEGNLIVFIGICNKIKEALDLKKVTNFIMARL